MPLFDVTYENIAYSETPHRESIAYTEADLKQRQETGQNIVWRPDGLVKVVDVHLSEDDGQEGREERKVFTSVTLRMEAGDQAEAEALPVPHRFLRALWAGFCIDKGVDLSPEEGWDPLEVEAVDDAVAEVRPPVRPRAP